MHSDLLGSPCGGGCSTGLCLMVPWIEANQRVVMGLKIKSPRPKVRRRGARIIVTFDDERVVYSPHYESKKRRVTEFSRADEAYGITYSNCGRFALAKGHCEIGPAQIVFDGQPFWNDPPVAMRGTEEEAWLFTDPADSEALYVSASHAGIANLALVVSAYTATLDAELASFLGVLQMLCKVEDIEEFRNSPRYRALRNFKFEFAPPDKAVGAGRWAKNKLRHEFTNYDEMLQESGGLLWPDQYERVRKGVDRIVTDLLQKPAGNP
jgi:hypothetical protein